MAAGGYPDAYGKGDPITGLDAAARLPGKVFHAGTGIQGGAGPHSGTSAHAGTHTSVATDATQIFTTGGRVLCAVGLGEGVAAAQAQAYALVHTIHWNLVQYRRDIGYRAIEREARSAGQDAARPN
jgi:phosphoribosylamine--glycine ligase